MAAAQMMVAASGTVLIVLDFQSGVLDTVPGAAEALHAATRAVNAARAASIRVVFVRLAYRAGMPEVAVANPVFGALRIREQLLREDAPSTGVHPSFEPRADEPVVTHHRIGAFTASDLQLLIGAADADRVVLAGVITSGVVLSTLMQAVDLDLAVTVLRNACRDRDAELHAALLDRMFPRYAEVIEVEEWAASLAPGTSLSPALDDSKGRSPRSPPAAPGSGAPFARASPRRGRSGDRPR